MNEAFSVSVFVHKHCVLVWLQLQDSWFQGMFSSPGKRLSGGFLISTTELVVIHKTEMKPDITQNKLLVTYDSQEVRITVDKL